MCLICINIVVLWTAYVLNPHKILGPRQPMPASHNLFVVFRT